MGVVEPWLSLLLLIVVANSAPIAARRLLGDRARWPVDGGLRLADGQPLLGTSKTWRGLAAGIVAAALLAPLAHLPVATGALIGAAAVAGDLVASFLKRRLRLAPSVRAPLLDQLPEALLPVLAVRTELSLTWGEAVLTVAAFTVIGLVLSPLFFALGIRRRPW